MDIIKKNLNTMLLNRNYKFIETTDTHSIYSSTKNKKEHKIIVFFTVDGDKVGVDYVKKMIIKTENMQIPHIILLSKDKLTPFANKFILYNKMKVEFFLFDELKFNITQHYLVPKHILLTCKESREIIDYYGTKNLPQIKKKDVMARYFDADIGQIFRIYRNEGGIFYRMVVN